MKKSIVFSLLLACMGALALPVHQALLTVGGYSGESTLTNFPVLVRISPERISGFSYADCAPGGADVAFKDAQGNILDREIDTWKTAGESLVWVRVPILTNNAAITMTYSDSAVTAQPACQTDGSVWASSGYAGVWHLNETDAWDSSRSGYDGTASTSLTVTDGALGAGVNFPAATTSDKIETVATSTSAFASGLTFETWARLGTVSGKRAFFGKEALATLKMDGNVLVLTTPGKTDFSRLATLSAGQWYHIVATFVPRGELVVYVDGVKTASQADTKGFNNPALSKPIMLGNNHWNQNFMGVLDECRLMKSAATEDWVVASYLTQSDASFLTYGAAETLVVDGVLIIDGSPDKIGHPTPPYGLVANLTSGATVALSMAGTADPGDGTVTNFLTGWRLESFDSVTGDTTPIRSSESPAAGESVTNCLYTHSSAAKFTWLWQARDVLGLGDLSVVTNGGDHIVFSADVSGIGYTAPSATLKFAYGVLPDEFVWTNAVNSAITSIGTVEATLPRLTPGAFYYIKAILETNDQAKDAVETGVVAIRTASYDGDPSSWQDQTAPIVNGFALDGTGSDTLVVSGNLASFPGDSCTLRVLVGLSPETLTNVWDDLSGATLSAPGAFSLTLHESDMESVRYLAPYSTYCVAVVATASNGKASTTPVLPVTMSPKACWTYVEESVDHNRHGHGYVTDGVWRLSATRTRDTTQLTLTGSGGKFYGAAPSPMNFTNVRDAGGVAYQVVEFGSVTRRNVGQLLYDQGPMVTELVAPDCLRFNTDYNFGNCTSMTNVVLNAAFSVLREGAFSGCASLRTIHPRRMMCATVPGRSFNGCASLEGGLEFPVATGTGGYAFSGCSSLESVIATNLTSIGELGFSGCTSLSEIAVSPKLTQVSLSGFEGCTALAPDSLGKILGKSLKYLGYTNFSKMGSEFHLCGSLEGPLVWDFPNLATNVVNATCFAGCSSLGTVIFKTPVAEIRDNAFYGIKEGAEIHMHAQPPALFGARVAGSQTAPYPRIYLKDNFDEWLTAMNRYQDLMRKADFDNQSWSSKVRADTITWATMAKEMAKDTSLCAVEMSGNTITKVNVNKKVLGIMLYCHNHAHWMCWILREPVKGTTLYVR